MLFNIFTDKFCIEINLKKKFKLKKKLFKNIFVYDQHKTSDQEYICVLVLIPFSDL